MDHLLRWILQGTALVAIVSVCLGGRRGVSASTRYRVWWTTLVLVVCVPLIDGLGMPGVGALFGLAMPAGDGAVRGSAPVAALPVPWSAWLVAGAALLWASHGVWRFGRAFAQLRAAKQACRPFPCVRETQLTRWKTVRNRGRRATLVMSDAVRAAGVLGLGYPRIAINPVLAANLTDEELDQVVLHEYAHVQRRDDLTSALQMIVRAVLGWHPAVWWIDRCLRLEREVACDDWVVGATAAPRRFATCLTRIADLSVGRDTVLAPACAQQSQLSARVMRLLDGRRNVSTRTSALAWATSAAMLTALSIGLAGRQSASLAPAAATPPLRVASVPHGGETVLPIVDTDAASRPPLRPAADADTSTARADAAPLPASDVVWAVRDSLATAPLMQSAAPPVEPDAAVDADLPLPSVAHPIGESTAWAPAAMMAEGTTNAGGVNEGWGEAAGTPAVVAAGKATGRAVADAGTAAYSGSRTAAVKTARFFSKVGKALARPF